MAETGAVNHPHAAVEANIASLALFEFMKQRWSVCHPCICAGFHLHQLVYKVERTATGYNSDARMTQVISTSQTHMCVPDA